MVIAPSHTTYDTNGIHQAGLEGLATSVIEKAVEDLQAQNIHTKSAIYFFKNTPGLLEYWLTAASHSNKHALDIEVAKKKLYQKACETEQRFIAHHRKPGRPKKTEKVRD